MKAAAQLPENLTLLQGMGSPPPSPGGTTALVLSAFSSGPRGAEAPEEGIGADGWVGRPSRGRLGSLHEAP